MTASIKLYTDSSAQLPRHVTAALDLEVVPIGISIDGASHDESDLDVDLFYTCLAAGSRATTSQPSPDRFAAAYEAAAASGASEVLSIHAGSEVQGTIGAAALAARDASLPVTLVDTGTASFGVGVRVLAAANAVAAGASTRGAVELIEQLAPTLGNVFIAARPPGGRIPSEEGLAVFGAHTVPLSFGAFWWPVRDA